MMGLDLATKLVRANIQYVCYNTIAVGWFVMALQYTGQGQWLTTRRFALMLVLDRCGRVTELNPAARAAACGRRWQTSGSTPMRSWPRWHSAGPTAAAASSFQTTVSGSTRRRCPPSDREDDLLEAIKCGASGYLLKGTGAGTGEPADADAVLTPRQAEVLALVAQGWLYKEIAGKLGMTERTLKFHMLRIVDKPHLKNRAAVEAYARKRSLSAPPRNRPEISP